MHDFKLNDFKLLDVTLRDGGHLNDFHFNEQELEIILNALDASGIDYIEIGYRNGSISPIENIGIAGLSPDQYLQFCKKYIQRANVAVMAHCKNIEQQDIDALKKHGVMLLRLCIPKGEHQPALSYVQAAKKAGLMVSMNLIHISQYSNQEIYSVVEESLPFEPSMIYFADSNGCLHPDRVSEIYTHCTKNYKIPFGFHGHDHIGLAQTNALAALASGATYIDASLAGAGKGIGNLKLEYFVAYQHSMKNQRYNIKPLVAASNAVRDMLPTCGYVSEGEFMRGIYDLSTKQLKDFLSQNKDLKE